MKKNLIIVTLIGFSLPTSFAKGAQSSREQEINDLTNMARELEIDNLKEELRKELVAARRAELLTALETVSPQGQWPFYETVKLMVKGTPYTPAKDWKTNYQKRNSRIFERYLIALNDLIQTEELFLDELFFNHLKHLLVELIKVSNERIAAKNNQELDLALEENQLAVRRELDKALDVTTLSPWQL